MEQLKISKIKAAGKNIRNTGLLILASNLTVIIAYLHLSSLSLFQLVNINSYLSIYGLISFILLILIITNIIKAGNNLLLCDSNDIDYDDIIESGNKQIVYRKTADNITLKIISTDYKTIGSEVYIDEKIAPDGEYKYLDDNKVLIVKNGKIEGVTIL